MVRRTEVVEPVSVNHLVALPNRDRQVGEEQNAREDYLRATVSCLGGGALKSRMSIAVSAPRISRPAMCV